MNLIGKAVHSKKYGAGHITDLSGTEFVVSFIDKSVSYPLKKEVFTNQLTFDNSTNQEKILFYFENPDLREYDDWLDYWDNQIKEQENRHLHQYNYSRPTSSSNGLSTPFKLREATLDIRTMLYLDVYDDFYTLFHQVQTVYLDLARSKILEYKKSKTKMSRKEFVTEINICAKSQVAQLCNPVLQKYTYLFLDPPSEFHRDSFDYNRFSLEVLPDENISFDIFSFYSFLYRIKQVIVSAAKYQDISLKTKSTPQVWKVLMDHLALILEKSLNDVVIDSSKPEMTDGELYVYDRLYSTTCHKESHPVEQAVYITPRMFEPSYIKLPAHYCKHCKKHLIGIRTLNLYEDTYGKLLVEREYMDDIHNDYDGFALESKLHRYGYNVRQGIYTDEERHLILMSLIDNNRMSYWEICKTLEQNIQMFYDYPNHDQAILKWQAD